MPNLNDPEVQNLWKMLDKINKSDPKAYRQMIDNMKSQAEKSEQAEKDKNNLTYHFQTLTIPKVKKLGQIYENFKIKVCKNRKSPYPKDETVPLQLLLATENNKSNDTCIVMNDKLLDEIFEDVENIKLFFVNLKEFLLMEGNLKCEGQIKYEKAKIWPVEEETSKNSGQNNKNNKKSKKNSTQKILNKGRPKIVNSEGLGVVYLKRKGDENSTQNGPESLLTKEPDMKESENFKKPKESLVEALRVPRNLGYGLWDKAIVFSLSIFLASGKLPQFPLSKNIEVTLKRFCPRVLQN